MTTLKELAAHLGLSPATVSRALNGFPEVGEKTRRRVVEASREFNYKANSSARKLATGKSDMVGIIFRSARNLLVDPHFVDFMAGLSAGLAKNEIDLLIRTAQPGAQLAQYERFVASGSVDGMIVSAPTLDDARIEMLQSREYPFVVHGRTSERPSYAFYDIDNDGAATQATNLLAALGHKRIAFINGPEDLAFAHQRLAAFNRETQARGAPIPPAFITHSDMSEEEGYRQARGLLAGTKMPTAFLCASTLQALGVMRAAGERRLMIGSDISIIAHDDVLPHMRSEHFNPALTVTRSPIREAGAAISQMLVDLIAGEDPKSLQHIAPVDLISRASTGAVPKGGDVPW